MNRNFYTPKKFTNEKIIMGFFTKNGGSSKKNYSSLNCSFNSKDSKQNILQNRDIVLNHLNIANSSLFIPFGKVVSELDHLSKFEFGNKIFL